MTQSSRWYASIAASLVFQFSVADAALVLDDTLQGATIGTRSGGQFVAGGWQVIGKNDTIYWHVPSINQGAVEFDVRGINPYECRVGMEDKTELFHMYDYTVGNSDINYNGGYRDNPFKHFVRKTGCLDTARVDSMELVWQIIPNYVEPDTAILSWDPARTYRFREEWGPDGAGNSVLRTYRDGVLLRTSSVPGDWAPVGHSVRIAASPRRAPDSGAPLGAVFSNIKVWDLSDATPDPPSVTEPPNGAVVSGPLVFIKWTGDAHTRYHVRVNYINDPHSAPAWDSGEVMSDDDYVWTGSLSQPTNHFVFVRLGSATAWGPWSTVNRRFRIDPSFTPAGPNLVQVKGHSLATQNGPFLGLGASYFQALRRAKYDRTRFNSDLTFLAAQGFNYVRVLSMVGWYEAWQGLEIAPVAFTNRAGASVAAWPDYWQQFRDMIDIIHDHGMRAQITIFADAQLMPSKTARIAHMTTVLQNLAGREHKVILIEVANEAWQNGFAGSQGVADLREFTQFLADRTAIPVAITSNDDISNAGITALYSGTAADIATVHFSRDIGTVEGGWLPVRDCYRAGQLPGVPPACSNEPIGPGASVAAEQDPIKLVMAAAFAWGANLPMYVFHSSAGVFGQSSFQQTPGVDRYRALASILPPDFSSWIRNDGKESAAPFTAYANNQPNLWWTEVSSPTSGALRNTGATKDGEFVAMPIGILSGGLRLEARKTMRFRVFNPMSTTPEREGILPAGGQITLAAGQGAYIIKGTIPDSATPVMPRGAPWKYLDTGANQGTAWRNLNFNDSGWSNGLAQFGFGDGDETTVIRGGPDTNRHVTTYFRRIFQVAERSAYTNVLINLLRDDGAIVYLNGAEVFRSNMTNNPVDYGTYALSVVGGVDESAFFPRVSPLNPVAGTNILAVEVHQANAISTDLSFDLELRGLAHSRPMASIISPRNNSLFVAPANILVTALAQNTGTSIDHVEFFAGGIRLGSAVASPYSMAWTNVPPGDYVLTVAAFDTLGQLGASTPVKISVRDIPISAGSEWKYLDNGIDPGGAWRTLNFNDAAWQSGRAQLGYGEDDESTIVRYGPDPNNKHVTTWFRRTFHVAEASATTNLLLRLLRDDGAIVYINGVEVFRSNMTNGTVTATTFAMTVVGDTNETTFFERNISPNVLVAGTNIIAVELHQANATSSDLGFDLELIAQTRIPLPSLAISRFENSVSMQWPWWASGYRLQSSREVGSSAVWSNVTTLPGWTSYTAAAPEAPAFYRLARE